MVNLAKFQKQSVELGNQSVPFHCLVSCKFGDDKDKDKEELDLEPDQYLTFKYIFILCRYVYRTKKTFYYSSAVFYRT